MELGEGVVSGYSGAGVLLCSCDSGAIISSEYKTVHYSVYFRETREGWPLLIVDMGNQRVQMKGVLPWLVRWALHAARHFCPALAALVG
jgi:hypothetical protein